MTPDHLELCFWGFTRNPNSKIYRWESPFALILVWKSLLNWKFSFHWRFGKIQRFHFSGKLYTMDSILSLKRAHRA